MIALFTDFGAEGPYLAQMEAVIAELAPDCKVVNLLSNAPIAEPVFSGYLLAALRHSFPANTIFLAVVDPGVGGERAAVVLQADGQFFVGPDNGLLNTIAVQATTTQWYAIEWRPLHCSNSFHGRDIFAPVAARLASKTLTDEWAPIEKNVSDWPADLDQIIYFDHYGNAFTGLSYDASYQGRFLKLKDRLIAQADTFSRVEAGEVFWYQNSCGLIEIAVNQGNAKEVLQLTLGEMVGWR